MTTTAQDVDGFKARSPWFKCYPQDWIEATRGLSLEQRAVYFDCLCIIYQLERQLPKDDRWMSHQLHISSRLWRSIRDALLKAGKLVETDDGYTNERAQLELDSRLNQRRTKSETALNRERTKREKIEKHKENNETAPQKQHYARAFLESESEERKKDSTAVPVPTTAREPSFAALPSGFLDRLTKAAEPCLDNPVNCLGLLSSATLSMWITQGCDPELDILPTITAAAVKYRGKRIRDWGYFTGMVGDAKAKRQAGLPARPTASVARPAPPRKRKSEDELYAEMITEAKAMGLVDEHQL